MLSDKDKVDTIAKFKTYIDNLEDDTEFFTKEKFFPNVGLDSYVKHCKIEIKELEKDIEELESELKREGKL